MAKSTCSKYLLLLELRKGAVRAALRRSIYDINVFSCRNRRKITSLVFEERGVPATSSFNYTGEPD